jgi:Tol biopolymer transport system component
VWGGPEVTLLGGVSRDGRYLSYVDATTGDLAVRDLRTGATRRLTARPRGSKEYAYFSAISPDAGEVAFAWFNKDGFYDLRAVGIDGANERVLYRNEEAGFVQPCAWTPDGRRILTLLFRSDNISQIAFVPAAGGPPQVLRSLNWVYPKRMDLSPDGRFIVYDSFAQTGGGERTLFLLSTNGDAETRLVSEPGNHLFPLWTPDGKHVVFASERAGVMGAWIVAVSGGKPDGPSVALRRDLGRALPMGITGDGDYYYGLRSGESDVFVTALANPAERPLRATIRYPGRNTMPAWSAGGGKLAFLSRRGAENFGEESRAIVIRALDSGEERELAPKLANLERAQWSPDERSLLVSGSDGKGRGGLFLVDTANAAVRPVVWEAGQAVRGFPGVWAAGGRSIFYIRNETDVRSRDLESGRETTVLRGKGLRLLAISPDGRRLAVASDEAIAILPAAGGEQRDLPFSGATELEWGADLLAARGADLWRLSPESGEARRLEMPGNRAPGFSLHPDGKRIALTAGRTQSEVWVMGLGR